MTRSPHADRTERRRRTSRWLALGAVIAAACGGRELSLGGDPATLSVGGPGGAGRLGAGGTGGAIAFGGTGGSEIAIGGNGGSALGGAGGESDDPYPPVAWANGQGYRDVCPEHDETSGFTCWHEESGTGTTCALDGSPVCNACSCAVPCEDASDCPGGAFGEPAGCFGSSNNVSSCFLTCDGGSCPTGMSCSTYPGTNDRVCMWVEPSAGMLPPAK